MRRVVIAFVVVLLVLPFVYGQAVCGNSIVESPEECDDGNIVDGDGCSAICLSEKEIHYVLYDLAINHNLLFSKVQDLLHIVNDLLFQLEIKTIEIQLTDFPCNQQPVSFWIPADLSPYGKLNEIDALINLLIKAIRDGGETNFGLSTQDLINSQSKLADAECLISSNQFRNAFNCKCLAYKDLLGVVDASVVCSDCAE